MRDTSLDTRQFVHGHARILHILGRSRIFAHLLHQTSCGSNWVADFMGERSGQFIERRLFFGPQDFFLLLHLALNLTLNGGDKDSLMNPSPAEYCREMANYTKAPESRGPEEPQIGRPGKHIDPKKQADNESVPH